VTVSKLKMHQRQRLLGLTADRLGLALHTVDLCFRGQLLEEGERGKERKGEWEREISEL